MDKEFEEITAFLAAQKPKVRKNVSIVKAPEDYPYMLHGTINGKIKEFVPRLAERYAKGMEDRSVNRVHVSDAVMGCFEGMSDLLFYLQYGVYGPDEEENKFMEETYKNGWYVYRLDYNYCLKPNDVILYDQLKSNEHWLVPYNDKTKTYKGKIIAKMILTEFSITNIGLKNDGYGKVKVVFLLEVLSDAVKITPNEKKVYTPGYYEITYIDMQDGKYNKISDDLVKVRRLTESEYRKEKTSIAPDLLLRRKTDVIKNAFNW